MDIKSDISKLVSVFLSVWVQFKMLARNSLPMASNGRHVSGSGSKKI